MIATTLNEIRKQSPCSDGWTKLLAHLNKTKADDEPLPLLTILDSNGLDDTIWCLRVLSAEHHGWILLYAVWCARQVQHLMTDQRSRDALDVAERYARGEATDAAGDAARAAGDTARAARDAASAAAWDAAWDARDAASAAAWDATWAAGDAARAAGDAARAARDAAWAAAWDAAWDARDAASAAAWDAGGAAARAAGDDAGAAAWAAAWAAQEKKLRELLSCATPQEAADSFPTQVKDNQW